MRQQELVQEPQGLQQVQALQQVFDHKQPGTVPTGRQPEQNVSCCFLQSKLSMDAFRSISLR
jgi:hypothetical protein